MVGAASFALVHALPGDMAYRIAAGRYGYDIVDSAAAEAVRAELGLDQPALHAFLDWLWNLLRLNLGRSLVSGDPVIEEVAHQLGHSVELAVWAVLLSLLIGMPLGLLAGLRAGSAVDRL
ncbi:MAG: ABC transporter permease, partial [Pseudomonadota bacterium]